MRSVERAQAQARTADTRTILMLTAAATFGLLGSRPILEPSASGLRRHHSSGTMVLLPIVRVGLMANSRCVCSAI